MSYELTFPARGTWIEMSNTAIPNSARALTFPARGTWIEMCLEDELLYLKSVDVPRKGNVDRNMSLQAVRGIINDVPRKGNVDRNTSEPGLNLTT